MSYQELVNKINLEKYTTKKNKTNKYKNKAANPKQIHSPKHCMCSSSWSSCVKDDQDLFVMWTAMWIIMLILH